MTLSNLAYFISFGDYRRNFLLVVVLTLVLLLAAQKRRDAFFVFVSSLGYVYSVILKYLFHHQRPSAEGIKSFLDVYSFPSSHVVMYTTFFGFIIYLLLTKKLLDKVSRYFISGFFAALIVTVGWSRVYLNAHYPIDIVAGYFFGVIYLLTTVYFYNKLPSKVMPKDKNKNY